MIGSNGNQSSNFRIYDADGLVRTRLSALAFALLIAIPIATTLLYGGVDTISLGLLGLAVTLLLCVWVADSWLSGEFRFRLNSLQLPIIALILLGAAQLLPLGDAELPSGALNIPASNAISLDPFSTRLFVARLFFYLLFFSAALAFVDSEKRAKRLAAVIIIFGSVVAFFAILQRLGDLEGIYGIRPTPHATPFGPFVNQHHFAGFMEMTTGLVFGLLMGGGFKRDRKAFLLIAAILMSTALVFTGSRGGVLSFAGVLVFAAAGSYVLRASPRDGGSRKQSRASTRKFAGVASGAAVSLVIVGLAFYLGAGDSMLRGFGFSQASTDVSSGRIHFWQVTLQVFAANPFIGSGLEAFSNAYTEFDTSSGAFRIEQAHNDYLQMLADGGVIGFLCVAVFVAMLFRNGIRNITATSSELGRSIAIGALAGCFGIAIHSFFDFPLRTPSNALFLLLLAVLATVGFSEKKA